MFGRKKKKAALFGTHIDPDCAYCAHHVSAGGEERCLRQATNEKGCKSFLYDPLRREPKTEAKLKDYDPDTFAL